MPLWKFFDYFLHLFVNVVRHRWLRRCWCSPASGWSRWQGELLSGSSLASGSWEQLGTGSRQLGAAGRGETSWNSHTVYTLYTCPPTLAWIMITTQEHNINWNTGQKCHFAEWDPRLGNPFVHVKYGRVRTNMSLITCTRGLKEMFSIIKWAIRFKSPFKAIVMKIWRETKLNH